MTPAGVTYVQKPIEGQQLCTVIHETGQDGRTSSNLEHDEKRVEANDIKTAGRNFSLEKNGFILERLEVPGDINWDDTEQVKQRYWPLAEKVIQRVTGASRVHVFDTTLRRGKLRAPDSKTESAKRGRPQGSVHVDYDHHSGIDRLTELLPDEAEKLRETPFAVCQLWRPLKGPVRSSPLGMIDVQTVDREDMTSYEIRRPERIGKNFAIHYSPKHSWWYADAMDVDECLLFICYHSRLDRARFVPHSGIRLLDVNDEEQPDRESVELRSYAFWTNEPKQEVQRVY